MNAPTGDRVTTLSASDTCGPDSLLVRVIEPVIDGKELLRPTDFLIQAAVRYACTPYPVARAMHAAPISSTDQLGPRL